MSSTTPNFQLKQDATSDNIGQTILDLYTNMGIIDSAIQDRKNDLTTHKTATVLDHPDGSVITVKLADKAVTTPKLDVSTFQNLAGMATNNFAPNTYTWIATAGQTLFALPTNQSYVPGFLWLSVGGVPQENNSFIATNGVSFTVAEALTAGTVVDGRWFQGSISSQVHHTSHYANGVDPIDVTQLQNYSQNIGDVTTLPTTSKQVVGAITENFNQIVNLDKIITVDPTTKAVTVTGKIVMTTGSIDWTSIGAPNATQVGARPSTWTPTSADVGALATTWVGTTHIDANGLYTGIIAANQINVGTLTGFTIQTSATTTQQIKLSGSELTATNNNLQMKTKFFDINGDGSLILPAIVFYDNNISTTVGQGTLYYYSVDQSVRLNGHLTKITSNTDVVLSPASGYGVKIENQTIVSTAGTGTVTPSATIAGYLPVYVNGTVYKLPLYNT